MESLSKLLEVVELGVSLASSSFFFFFFAVLGPHLWCMEVPELGVELELCSYQPTP